MNIHKKYLHGKFSTQSKNTSCITTQSRMRNFKRKENEIRKRNVSPSSDIIEKVKDNEILRGLGELIGEKEKAWVKASLRKETILLLKNYQSILK